MYQYLFNYFIIIIFYYRHIEPLISVLTDELFLEGGEQFTLLESSKYSEEYKFLLTRGFHSYSWAFINNNAEIHVRYKEGILLLIIFFKITIYMS